MSESATSVQTAPRSRRKRGIHITELVLFILVALALIGVDLMFYFWPFRYREVHPLLQQTFASTVVVQRFHRTYFPHPGFVAEGVTFYRHGDTRIPPLAAIDRLRVVGTWSSLIFHPHTLYQIWLEGVHVQIPPRGTVGGRERANGPWAAPSTRSEGPSASSQMKMHIETIVADAAVVDFLRPGKPPLRFHFATLQVHDVAAKRPFTFYAKVSLPALKGVVAANGSLGPLNEGNYGNTPLQGTYALLTADLSEISGLSGHVAASGRYRGQLDDVEIEGKASIPDFRAGDAHKVRMDTAYNVAVNGMNWGVTIRNAELKTGNSVISAKGTVSTNPAKIAVQFTAEDADLHQLLEVVEEDEPAVNGKVSFDAAAEFSPGPGPFLKRLNLKGHVAVDQVTFVKRDTQHEMDAFSAREQKTGDSTKDPNVVSGAASSDTTFHDGIAYFPDIDVHLPGATARMHGTFNLLSTKIDMTGKATLERSLPHAVTGWKSWLLKPLAPFFRHKDAGAVVSVAVTGTSENPKIGQDIFHDK